MSNERQQPGTEVATTPAQDGKEHQPPEGSSVEAIWNGTGQAEVPYRATGEWMLLREKDKPVAEMFSVSYVSIVQDQDAADRPVTFVFNGGPGASSAYLHLGRWVRSGWCSTRTVRRHPRPHAW